MCDDSDDIIILALFQGLSKKSKGAIDVVEVHTLHCIPVNVHNCF